MPRIIVDSNQCVELYSFRSKCISIMQFTVYCWCNHCINVLWNYKIVTDFAKESQEDFGNSTNLSDVGKHECETTPTVSHLSFPFSAVAMYICHWLLSSVHTISMCPTSLRERRRQMTFYDIFPSSKFERVHVSWFSLNGGRSLF